MKLNFNTLLAGLVFLPVIFSACAPTPAQSGLQVLAVETFLADIAQNVAGERLKVDSLVPLGMDPHAFEPTPRDVQKIAESDVLILNGAGFEEWAHETIESAGGQRQVIEASAGLESRETHHAEEEAGSDEEHAHEEGDPHFWLDPSKVVRYVENIRDGLIAADPQGKDTYTQNAAAYIAQLVELDAWIKTQVALIPEQRRLIVTNHESFGYFADRYGFTIIGAVIPSVSTDASPSAQQMAALVDHIRETGAVAIFLETGASPQLAEQIAAETGVRVVDNLYTHSITPPNGEAPTYLDMMKRNVNTIVEALKR